MRILAIVALGALAAACASVSDGSDHFVKPDDCFDHSKSHTSAYIDNCGNTQ